MITNYLQSGLVEFAEPDYRLQPAAEPNDPRYLDGSLWHLHNTGQSGGVNDADIDGPEGWDTMRHATNVIVAVVDTGVRYTHEDLAPNMWVNSGEIPGNGIDDDGNGYVDDVHGINAAAEDGNPVDLAGHGTQVAGFIGAAGNNGKGVAGVAWSVQLMALRFFDDAGNGYITDAVECINYARLNGAHIINASFGTPGYSSTLHSAIDSCRDAGIIMVAAAGNDATDTDATPTYPASFDLDNIVSVAATTRTEALASFSNFGATTVDLGAPGASLVTTSRSGDTSYTTGSGTSFAAPVTAGAFALMKARHPTETYLQHINRVYDAVDPLASLQGKTLTGGRLNLANALGPGLMAEFSISALSGELPLTVDFTDLSFGEITSWGWEFGDGASSTVQNPSHTFNQPGEFTVRLTVTDGTGQTSEATATISVVANYEIQSASFNWIDPTGMTALSLTDNGVSPAQALPFSFNFYGENHSSVYVSANGMLGFVADALGAHDNVDLPNSALPNNMIAPWWDDLNPEGGGGVHVGVTGDSPNRRFVVSWVGVPHRNPGKKAAFTFQVVLEEADQRIVFQYLNVDAGHSVGAGKSATIGVENPTGTVAARYSYNGETLLQDNQAIAFVPASVPSMAVTPNDAFASQGTKGGPFSPVAQDYIVSNTGTASLNWQASAAVDWVSITPAFGTIAPGGTTSVAVSLNANADSLPAGVHEDLIHFTNLDNGAGDTTRMVSLTVEGVGVLAVTPADQLNASGVVGGPFSPSSMDYQLTNTGDGALDWAASHSSAWLSLSAASGNLAAGESVGLTVSLNATASDLAPGSYTDTLSIINTTTGDGDTTRTVSLTVDPLPGELALLSTVAFQTSGFTGGPFTTEQQVYELKNDGGAAVEWSAASEQGWLVADPSAGTLGPGEQANIALRLAADATGLPAGIHQDVMRFLDVSQTGGSLDIAATLEAFARARLEVTPKPGEPGSFVITINGHPGHEYRVETTENFKEWIHVFSGTLDGHGNLQYSHSDPHPVPIRSFRVLWMP